MNDGVRLPVSRVPANAAPDESGTLTPRSALRKSLAREHRLEILRIFLTGAAALLFWREILPLPGLLAAVGFGLYPLARSGIRDVVRERRVGTEVFIVIATVVAMLGREYVAGSVLLAIVLIAELIAEPNIERARASIRSLIGSVPQTALVRRGEGEQFIALEDLLPGDVVIVRAGERIPVDGAVMAGAASVNQAPITGESMPLERLVGWEVYAGTVVDMGRSTSRPRS